MLSPEVRSWQRKRQKVPHQTTISEASHQPAAAFPVFLGNWAWTSENDVHVG